MCGLCMIMRVDLSVQRATLISFMSRACTRLLSPLVISSHPFLPTQEQNETPKFMPGLYALMHACMHLCVLIGSFVAFRCLFSWRLMTLGISHSYPVPTGQQLQPTNGHLCAGCSSLLKLLSPISWARTTGTWQQIIRYEDISCCTYYSLVKCQGTHSIFMIEQAIELEWDVGWFMSWCCHGVIEDCTVLLITSDRCIM